MKQASGDMVTLLQEYTDQAWDAAALAGNFPTQNGITQTDFMAALAAFQAAVGNLSTLRVALEKIIP